MFRAFSQGKDRKIEPGHAGRSQHARHEWQPHSPKRLYLAITHHLLILQSVTRAPCSRQRQTAHHSEIVTKVTPKAGSFSNPRDPARSPMGVEAIRRWGWVAARHTLWTGWRDLQEPEGRAAGRISYCRLCALDANQMAFNRHLARSRPVTAIDSLSDFDQPVGKT